MKPAFQLPFKCGQTWRASTYGPTPDKPNQHHSPDSDALDMKRLSDNSNISANEDVLASAAGTVIEAHDTNSEDPPYGGVVTVQHEGEWKTQYVHLDNALSVKKNDKVIRGQKIGVVGGKIEIFGTENAHLHYVQFKGDSGVRATFNGVDTSVHAGAGDAKGNYPTENLISANCQVPPFGSPVSAVSRNSNSLDVFAIGRDGRILGAAWEQQVLDGQWRGWWYIRAGTTSKNGKIASVSRDANKLDVFVVGNDGIVYTAAWDHNVSEGKWRGWWKIVP